MKNRRLRSSAKRRGGFILLEVVVAMTLLALILTPLAAMVFTITARSHRIIGSAYRNGVLMQQVNLLESLPYDSLAVGTSVSSVTANPYPHTTTITVAEVWVRYQLKMKKVTLVIAPANTLYRPDTTIFIRSIANTPDTFIEDDDP